MAEIVNLRLARKAKARSDASTAAATNRAKFGETKAARTARTLDEARAARLLDGAKREPE